ncbi:alpha-E domain-containing protein [soil metagenome]
MLSRTADHLFWMARYMERAENTARMLDVNYQTSLLQPGADTADKGWRGLLSISELTADYAKRRGDVTGRDVMDYMVSDVDNPSSIANCLMTARENARAVRGTLTTEVWETQNQTWLEFNRMLAAGAFRKDPGEFFEWVKFRSHLSRGVTLGTMLQDEAFHFMRMGTFLERADNTARLLDVKFHGMENEFFGSGVTGGLASQTQTQTQEEAAPGAGVESTREGEYDFYHWSAILRSMSGFEVYRKVYRNVIRPEKVAELLILRADMPRSLAACVYEVNTNLQMLANDQSGDTLRRAGRLRADLEYGRIDEILATGLHAYLTQFLERVGTIGVGISRDFLVPVPA